MDGVPAEIMPAHGHYTPARLTLYVMAYNTKLALESDDVASREGREIIGSRNRVPSSRAVDSPLDKFQYRLIDPAIPLDEWDKWSALWSSIFPGGKAAKKEE